MEVDNKITLRGSITAPAHLSFLDEEENETGQMMTFSLVTSRRFRKKGKWIEVSEWHAIEIHNASFIDISIQKELKKGDIVSLTGRLQYSTYQNKDQQTVKKAVISVSKNHQFEIIPRTTRSEKEQAKP